MTRSLEQAKDFKMPSREWLTPPWESMKSPSELAREILPANPTSIDEDVIRSIGDKISSAPEGFRLHKHLERVLAKRKATIEDGEA